MTTTPSKSSNPGSFSTSELCKIAGVTRGQLRLYEDQGLIEKPARTANGYRKYNQDTVTRLKAIHGLKDVGLTLSEIATLLSERDFNALTPTQLQQKAREILNKTELKIRQLEIIKTYLSKFAAGDRSILDEPECRFLTEFLTAESQSTNDQQSQR